MAQSGRAPRQRAQPIAAPNDLPLNVRPPVPPPAEGPDLSFTVLRSADLVVLGIEGYHVALRATAKGPVLVPVAAPPGQTARLVVHWPFQHLAERAFYEITNQDSSSKQPPTPLPPDVPPNGVELETQPPIEARAAGPSRVVHEMAPGESIPFSVAGVLAALSRLPLLVAATATPRPHDIVFVPQLPIGGGLVLGRGSHGLVVATQSRGRRRSVALPAVLNASNRLSDVMRSALSLRNARSLLATETATALVALPAAERPTRSRRAGATVSVAALPGPALLGDGLILPVPGRVRRRHPLQPPTAAETAIEAPYRLIISPSSAEGFTHAVEPVAAPTDTNRVELWHSRIGVRATRADGTAYIDERADPQRIIRAIWNRDADFGPEPATHSDDPFRTSLDPLDRFILVRQSADPTFTTPLPIDARRLELSALGAWLDLHGSWWDTTPYTSRHIEAITGWDHVAPMGRDQYVRVLYPGYLFPFGHRCVLVKVTERKIKKSAPHPHAYLYQRKFLAIIEPVKNYTQADLPFTEVRIEPLVTPDIADPLMAGTPNVIDHADLFWPTTPAGKFAFRLDCRDATGGFVRVFTPLLFVAESFADAAKVRTSWEADGAIAAHGQQIAYAGSAKPGDTELETTTLHLTGDPILTKLGNPAHSVPRLDAADVIIPAMRHLAPDAPSATVQYAGLYLTNGFGGAANAGDVWAQLVDLSAKTAHPTGLNTYGADLRTVSFSKGTDKAGGFVQPDLPIRGLSRIQGAIGDVATVAANKFDPAKFLAGVFPKLFGLFDLLDILSLVGLDLSKAPAFITSSLDAISALLADITDLAAATQSGMGRAAEDMVSAPTQPLKEKAQQARDTLKALHDQVQPKADQLVAAVHDLLQPGSLKDPATVAGKVSGVVNDLKLLVTQISDAGRSLTLAPPVKADVAKLTSGILPLLQDATVVDKIAQFVNGFDPKGLTVRASLLWQPVIKDFTLPGDTDALFTLGTNGANGFTLAVEARASGSGGTSVDVLAEIRDFQLHLLPGAPLMVVGFDRIAFHATTSAKPEVDVVFSNMQFVGVLGFIETLRQLVPFDGFSDPPFVDVSPQGIDAGFSLALPGVGVGVFSLENISLGADCRIPFLGDAVTVGFNFCTRERPFQLTVMCIGGGGFVGLRVSPKGMVVLEMALEFGAALSIDLGVASGSVSVMGGVYLKLEANEGQLTGYFRIRGEVDVLGLISASITLELSLTYEFDTGKMVGRASINIEVEVLFFSASVEVSCERRFAGSNGDPTFAEILAVAPGGASPAWTDYCQAFASE